MGPGVAVQHDAGTLCVDAGAEVLEDYTVAVMSRSVNSIIRDPLMSQKTFSMALMGGTSHNGTDVFSAACLQFFRGLNDATTSRPSPQSVAKMRPVFQRVSHRVTSVCSAPPGIAKGRWVGSDVKAAVVCWLQQQHGGFMEEGIHGLFFRWDAERPWGPFDNCMPSYRTVPERASFEQHSQFF